MPDVNLIEKSERGQDEGQNHRGILRRDDNALPVEAIGGNASERRKQKNRNLAGEPDRTQQQRRTGEAVDKPGLGHTLHPGADQRNQLATKEELKVAVPERTPGDLPARSTLWAGFIAVIGGGLMNGGSRVRHDVIIG